jgi:hypothetical protein
VIIDRQSVRDSRWWIAISLAILLVTSVWYPIYAARAPQGPSGGSIPGLVFASVGTAIIGFAWFLTVRKWRRSARWGKAYAWLQGHVYLSIVSYPVILYHAGFHFGGPLTATLMWAFTVCYFSGLLVLILQQVLPRLMLREIPLETIYDQIDQVARRNLAAADDLVEAHATVTATVPDLGEDDFQLGGGAASFRSSPVNAAAELRTFYDRRVRPYLAEGLQPADRPRRAAVVVSWAAAVRQAILPRTTPAPTPHQFLDFRKTLPDGGLQEVLDTLEGFVEERRQFALQKRMQHVLHGWLLLHVPASWIMIALLPLHAIMSLRY